MDWEHAFLSTEVSTLCSLLWVLSEFCELVRSLQRPSSWHNHKFCLEFPFNFNLSFGKCWLFNQLYIIYHNDHKFGDRGWLGYRVSRISIHGDWEHAFLSTGVSTLCSLLWVLSEFCKLVRSLQRPTSWHNHKFCLEFPSLSKQVPEARGAFLWVHFLSILTTSKYTTTQWCLVWYHLC